MTLSTPLMLMGAPGSPYTRKMLALLRYRRIPYALKYGNPRDMPADLPKPKVGLLPTFFLPDETGTLQAVVDSTPLIRRFERDVEGRSAVPPHPVLAFLDELLEDYADEWLTKAMFHYRWHYQRDAEFAGNILPRWRVVPTTEEELAPVQAFIKERQISRLYVVGSNDVTAPVIEEAYRRYLRAMSTHLERHSFLFGGRPASSDFAAYGQLTQLAKVDPTPMEETIRTAPRLYAWVDVVDDLSGLEPTETDWILPDSVPASLIELFAEMGRTYVPVMLANETALKAGADEVRTEVEGRPWVQQPFPYQGRCLTWLRESYGRLSPDHKEQVNKILSGTGCEPLFADE